MSRISEQDTETDERISFASAGAVPRRPKRRLSDEEFARRCREEMGEPTEG